MAFLGWSSCRGVPVLFAFSSYVNSVGSVIDVDLSFCGCVSV